MLSLKPMYKTWRVFDQPIGMFVYFFVRCENLALYYNKKLLLADPCCRSVIKEFAHVFSCAYIGSISSYGCSWEVWRALKKLELLSAAPRATLTHFSCSPNFPRASITRFTHAKQEQILNSVEWRQRLGITHCWHQKNNRWLSKDISGGHMLILS